MLKYHSLRAKQDLATGILETEHDGHAVMDVDCLIRLYRDDRVAARAYRAGALDHVTRHQTEYL